MTIPESDKNDFKAVCTKLMNQNPGELAEGSLSQADFKKINVKHFNLWSERAFVRKHPVRYIGLQVHRKGGGGGRICELPIPPCNYFIEDYKH